MTKDKLNIEPMKKSQVRKAIIAAFKSIKEDSPTRARIMKAKQMTDRDSKLRLS